MVVQSGARKNQPKIVFLGDIQCTEYLIQGVSEIEKDVLETRQISYIWDLASYAHGRGGARRCRA